MHRTQLYLDGELYDRLSSLAKRQGRTMSDLVREALETVYGAGHSESRKHFGGYFGPMARSRGPRRHRGAREKAATGYAAATPPDLTSVLFDSDVVIEILRGQQLIIRQATELEQAGVLTYFTPITVAEVYAGVRPGEESLTEAFFRARGEALLDGECGRLAGRYLSRYARSHGVEIADALVAAAANTLGFRLWTLNRKHYPMDDLRFFPPAET